MLVLPAIPSFCQAKCLNVAVSLPKVAFALTAHLSICGKLRSLVFGEADQLVGGGEGQAGDRVRAAVVHGDAAGVRVGEGGAYLRALPRRGPPDCEELMAEALGGNLE